MKGRMRKCAGTVAGLDASSFVFFVDGVTYKHKEMLDEIMYRELNLLWNRRR